MILTREQVDALTIEECESALKRLERKFPINREITKLTPEVYDQVDAIAETLLYLEDRIKSIDLTEKLAIANAIRWKKI